MESSLTIPDLYLGLDFCSGNCESRSCLTCYGCSSIILLLKTRTGKVPPSFFLITGQNTEFLTLTCTTELPVSLLCLQTAWKPLFRSSAAVAGGRAVRRQRCLSLCSLCWSRADGLLPIGLQGVCSAPLLFPRQRRFGLKEEIKMCGHPSLKTRP